MAKKRKQKTDGTGSLLFLGGLAGYGAIEVGRERFGTAAIIVAAAVGVLILILLGYKIRRAAIRKSILRDFDSLTGLEFEQFCCHIFSLCGFRDVSGTPGSRDFGVDLIGSRDGMKYAIQCKRYSGKVGVKAVQEIAAGRSFYNCDAAAVVTNRYFTKAAVELAAATGVELIDRDQLAEMVSRCRKAF
jgi:restriction system protein